MIARIICMTTYFREMPNSLWNFTYYEESSENNFLTFFYIFLMIIFEYFGEQASQSNICGCGGNPIDEYIIWHNLLLRKAFVERSASTHTKTKHLVITILALSRLNLRRCWVTKNGKSESFGGVNASVLNI